MDYISYAKRGQGVIASIEEILSDERFSWRKNRVKAMKLSELYDLAGYPDYAARSRDCATYLQFGVYSGGSRRLLGANFCKLRLCPMCIARRARRNAYQLSKVLNAAEREHGVKYLFLTLTIRNVDGEHLGETLGRLADGWQRLLDQRQVRRSVRGWFRAIEITRRSKGYHPHIHAILAVDADYFSAQSRRDGTYLHQADLIERWQRALKVDYRPSVRIQVARAKNEPGKALACAGGAAAKEAAKYTVKDSDYIDPTIPPDKAAAILRDYTVALYRRRLTAFGGILKQVARSLDAEDMDGGDLVRAEDEDVRTDILEMVERYNWRLGAGDYVLSSRETPPLEIAGRGQLPDCPALHQPKHLDPDEERYPEDDVHKFWLYDEDSPWDG